MLTLNPRRNHQIHLRLDDRRWDRRALIFKFRMIRDELRQADSIEPVNWAALFTEDAEYDDE